jgi:hypothetical protein
VGRFTMRERADDRELVGDLGRLRQGFAEHFAGDLGRDDPHLAAVFDRRVRLGIERFLMGDAAGQEDVDHALGLGRNEVVVLLLGLGVLHAEVIAEREPQSGQRADRKETTTVDVRAQTHTDLPKCLRPHMACLRVCSAAAEKPDLFLTSSTSERCCSRGVA